MTNKDDWPKEKSWKNVYTRSEKLRRARQLGFPYPRVQIKNLVSEEKARTEHRNVLFVCSRNQWRSPTAERIWKNHPGISVRSAGTSPNARHPASQDDIRWADVIFAMEEKHKNRLLASFGILMTGKVIHVLDIPDDYKYMDPELVEELEHAVGPLLRL
jgi:predicted protein tyrosine phosphatase